MGCCLNSWCTPHWAKRSAPVLKMLKDSLRHSQIQTKHSNQRNTKQTAVKRHTELAAITAGTSLCLSGAGSPTSLVLWAIQTPHIVSPGRRSIEEWRSRQGAQSALLDHRPSSEKFRTTWSTLAQETRSGCKLWLCESGISTKMPWLGQLLNSAGSPSLEGQKAG